MGSGIFSWLICGSGPKEGWYGVLVFKRMSTNGICFWLPSLPHVTATIATHFHLAVQLAHELGGEDGLGQLLRQRLEPAECHRPRQHTQPHDRLYVTQHRLLSRYNVYPGISIVIRIIPISSFSTYSFKKIKILIFLSTNSFWKIQLAFIGLS